MREPVEPGWAEEQAPAPFLYTKENETITKNNADFGVRQAQMKMRMNNYFSRNDSRVILLLMFLFISIPILALNTSETRTINVTTAGKLSTLLPQNERGYVVDLTLTGKLNGTDFNILRTMATDQKLQILDLSGANIVSGGESYYSNYGTDYYTKNNEFGYALFYGCKKIQKVVLPNSLVTIGQSAFWYCTSLKTIIIGPKVTTIKPGLWGGCRQLTDVQIQNNSNFHLTNGILYNKDYSIIIAALQTWNYGDLTIRSGVKEIQYNAFAFCSKLTSISFPSSVTTIGDTAFEYTGITSVKFTSSITSIGSFAFSGCESLKQLDLTPLKVTSLDYGVFMTSKIEIVYLPKTLKELKQAVFSRTPLKHIFAYTATPATMYDLKTSSPTFEDVETKSCIVHVPQGKVNTYKSAAGWKDFLYITDSQEIEASTNEAYAVYTTDGTLTFYYDKQKSSRSGTKYDMNAGSNAPGWYTDHRQDIKKVVFNSSFAEARPTSTYRWFGLQNNTEKSILSEIIGIENLNTSSVMNMNGMFRECESLKSVNVSHFNTNKVEDMAEMFYGCTSLTSLDVSNFETGNVTNMAAMFYACWSLTNLDVSHFNTDKVTDMRSMFGQCSALKSLDLSHFDTSNVSSMESMFWACHGLSSLDLSHFDNKKVTNMSYMFWKCTGLKSLNLSGFGTSNVMDMEGMFDSCSGLINIDLSHFDTKNVVKMSWMFNSCNSLVSIDLSNFNTSNVNSIGHMFNGCSALTTIYASEKWNMSKVSSSAKMFNGCSNLIGGAGTKYDANHVDVTYAHIDGGSNNPGYLTDKNATSLMNLQEFIDANAGAMSVVDVDLSKFYDVVRDVTLNVSTGASYRFFNGTLSRSEILNAPVMYISKGSTVEISDGAVVTSQGHLADDLEGQFKVEATIKLNGGSLSIIGGKIEGACGGRKHVENGMIIHDMTIDNEDPAVELTNDNDSFMMTEGEVRGYFLCNANNANINFMGGEINGHYYESQSTRATPYHIYEPLINTYSDIHINGLNSHTGCRDCFTIDDGSSNITSINEFFVSLHGMSKVHLHKGGIDTFTFTVEGRKDGDVLMIGENYNITDEDMAGMSVRPFSYYSEKVGYYLKQECYLELKNNKVYLRFKPDELPNTGCDEEWLQQKLDEIASQKPSEPVELTICMDGIKLTKNIMVAKDCKVVLTGGPITSDTSIDYRYGREGLFMVYGELGFHDINLNFQNDAKGDGSLGYFWSGGGKLEHNKDTVFTTNGTFVGGLGELTITDAELYIGGEEMIISSGINTTISDYVRLLGQKTYCNGKIAVNMKTNPETGLAQLPIFGVDEVHVTTSLDLWAPENSLRDVYLYKDASIITYENGFMHLQISGEWDQMAVGRAFITSASIGQNDYNNMTFTGMPTNRKAEFAPSSHQVCLMSTSQIDMQASLSGLTYISQTAPTTLYLNSDAVNMVYQSTAINHQNVTFNGMPNGATSRSRLHFTKDQILTIGKVGRLTLTNIDITGEDGNEGFEVNGKLIISENVHVSNLPCLLHICAGGSVYASAALRNPISIQFVNGLVSGNTVIAGTDGYQLTETDLDYITVEGCELQLDKVGNRIIALNGTGIEAIKDIPETTLQDGVFDLGGRKVVPARQGVYIIKEGEMSRKIYVK